MQHSSWEPQQQCAQFYPSQDIQAVHPMDIVGGNPLSLSEQEFFGEYDHQMMAVALAADYDDASWNHYEENTEQVDEDYCVDDDMMESTESYHESSDLEEYNYEEDSLLHLIVGVQSYLSDMPETEKDRRESPLLDLQYKMYTYLKQRACDMGLDTSNLY